MGGAPLASEKDPAAVFVNPAGMAGMKHMESYFSSTNMFAGLAGVDSINTSFVATGLPLKTGTLGLGVGVFNAAGLKQEQTVTVGFAKTLFDKVQVGVAGKYLHHSYMPEGDALAAQDPVFQNGTSRSAFAIDLGAVAPIRGPVRFHFAIKNINQPNVGLVTEDRVEREFQMGSVVNVLGWKATGGIAMANGQSPFKSIVPSLGLEKELYNGRVAFRFGASTTEWGGGIGVKVGKIGFDYALVLNQNLKESNAVSHTVGLRYRFGGPL